MKRRLFLVSGVLGLVACGVAENGAPNRAPASPREGEGAAVAEQPTLPPNAPPPVTGTPSIDELTEQYGVFVSVDGTADGDGSRERPLSSISKAIDDARASAKRVYVCKGTYRESVVLANAVSVIGGYDCGGKWVESQGERSKIVSPTIPALVAKNIVNDTSFIGFDVSAPDASPANPSSIGLIAQNAKLLRIAKTKISAGKGLDGTPGTTPDAPSNGPEANGGAGAAGYGPGDYPPNGPVRSEEGRGARGVSACGGGPGGWGGSGGFYACSQATSDSPPKYIWKVYHRNVAPVDDPWFEIPPIGPETTMTGTPGGAGADGSSAAEGGRLGPDGYTPANGTAGTSGAGGDGGRGGTYAAVGGLCEVSKYAQGSAGPGGGAGGCGGLAGTPGTGGGASIAALLSASEGLTFDASVLLAGTGGDGGLGSAGSTPTAGGLPGTPHTAARPGDAGGRGGRPGVSGSGAGGPSIGIACTGGAPKLTNDAAAKPGRAGKGAPAVIKTFLDLTWTLPASADGATEAIHSF